MRKAKKSVTIRDDTSSKKRKVKLIKKVRAKVPRTRNLSTMTESEYFSKIRSGLRNTFRWWKPAMKALENASRPYTGPNKRQKKEYQCAKCKEWFPRRSVEIDHIIPCGSLNSYEDIVPFIKNLTQENVNMFQPLCRPCHKLKTDNEKLKRSIKNKKK